MTTHKTLKRRVRARMDKTGERYTAAARFTSHGPAKSQVALQQDPLSDAAAVEELRAFWRPRLADLKKRLEGGPTSA